MNNNRFSASVPVGSGKTTAGYRYAMDRAISDAKAKLRTMKFLRAPGVIGYHAVRPLGGQPPYLRVLFRNPDLLRLCPDRIGDVEIKREMVGESTQSHPKTGG